MARIIFPLIVLIWLAYFLSGCARDFVIERPLADDLTVRPHPQARFESSGDFFTLNVPDLSPREIEVKRIFGWEIWVRVRNYGPRDAGPFDMVATVQVSNSTTTQSLGPSRVLGLAGNGTRITGYLDSFTINNCPAPPNNRVIITATLSVDPPTAARPFGEVVELEDWLTNAGHPNTLTEMIEVNC